MNYALVFLILIVKKLFVINLTDYITEYNNYITDEIEFNRYILLLFISSVLICVADIFKNESIKSGVRLAGLSLFIISLFDYRHNFKGVEIMMMVGFSVGFVIYVIKNIV